MSISRKYSDDFVIKVMEWCHQHGGNQLQTSKQFGVDPRLISKWKKMQVYEKAIRNEMQFRRAIGSATVTVEKAVPDEIQEIAKIIIKDAAALQYNCLLVLTNYVNKILKKIEANEEVKNYEYDKLIRITQILMPYTTNEKITKTEESDKSVFQLIQEKLSKAQKIR